MAVVGPKEAESGDINVRFRGSEKTKSMDLDEFIGAVQGKIADKSVDTEF